MGARWLVVLLVATALVATPVALAARRVPDVSRDPVALARLVLTSATWGWSGSVRSSGALQVPQSESFATLGDLLGEENQLRVWWRGPQEWRVDRLRGTGETDLFRSRGLQVRWVFESDTATVSPVSEIRLPDAADLLPATLARSLLRGVRDDELSRLPAARVAGVVAPGLRVTPDDPAASVDHVDVWAEPGSGLPLRVEVHGADPRPVLTTEVTSLDLDPPDPATTVFRPAPSTTLAYEDAVDVAAAANAFAPDDLPATLAGLPTRDGADPGAVGVYGRGPTALIVLPLRGQVARPLRDRLAASGSARRADGGALAAVGPVTLLVTRVPGGGGAFLLAGTVTPETAERAADELSAVTR